MVDKVAKKLKSTTSKKHKLRKDGTRRGGIEDLVVATNPKSSFAEAVKSVKTNVTFSSVEKELKTILVTSPESGDGKSLLVANLATAFAQDGKSVLVVDGDMRKGRQHEIFGIENDKMAGYSNYILRFKETENKGLMAFIRPEIYVKPTQVQGVYLLPAGPTPPNPLELISSENNRKLLESFREQYDIIIIDCPPALGLSDALVMSKYADVNIVTVTNAKTKIDQLEDVKKNFEKVNSKISGVVINKAKVGGGYYSSYYADKYYSKLNND